MKTSSPVSIICVALLGLGSASATSHLRRLDDANDAVLYQEIFDGAQVTNPEEFPQFTLLCYGGETTICGGCVGTLITNNHVLTAASCMYGRGPPTAVRIGALNNTGGEFVEVESVTVHPNYDPAQVTPQNDIAIVKLNKFIAMKPADFNRFPTFPTGTDTVNVFAYAFGGVDATETPSTVLRRAPYVIQTDATCNSHAADTGVAFDQLQQLCTFATTVGFCGGDGGALIVDKSNTVLGILNRKFSSCRDGTADIWTDVRAYESFIDSVTSITPTPSAAPSMSPSTAPIRSPPASAPAPTEDSGNNETCILTFCFEGPVDIMMSIIGLIFDNIGG